MEQCANARCSCGELLGSIGRLRRHRQSPNSRWNHQLTKNDQFDQLLDYYQFGLLRFDDAHRFVAFSCALRNIQVNFKLILLNIAKTKLGFKSIRSYVQENTLCNLITGR